MEAHLTFPPTLAGTEKVTLHSVVLEPPCNTMSLKEETHEVFFFFD